MRVEVSEIDTYGFPYVHGVPPYVYREIPVPSSEKECAELLLAIRSATQDICDQLALYKIKKENAGEEDPEWLQSVITKKRILQHQRTLLSACQAKFREERRNREFASDENPGLRDMSLKINAMFKRLDKVEKRNHILTEAIQNMRSVLLALLNGIDEGTIEQVVEQNREVLTAIKNSSHTKDNWGKVKDFK